MKEKDYYPKLIENIANRNFNLGDKVRIYFRGKWRLGEVDSKYKKPNRGVPYIMIRTDEKVDEDPEAYLNGFGIEIQVISPRVMFCHEPFGFRGDKIYSKTLERKMTPEEKEEWDNCPF